MKSKEVPDEKKIYSLIGLAKRAGYVESGEFCCEKAVKEGRAKLVIIAGDASDNTKKKFTNMCSYYKKDLVFFGIKDGLGHSLGNEFRASVAVTDSGFAEKIKGLISVIKC